jgi:hypothetical protein
MIVRIIFFMILGCFFATGLHSQVFMTRNATVRFFSEAPLENIEAYNRQVSCALNTQTGELAFRVLIRSFSFDKALMQEHFNDNFMHSHEYPNAVFEGRVEQFEEIDIITPGVHEVTVTGNLTIKDVTRQISERGTLEIRNGEIHAYSVFTIMPEDYNVQIPLRFARNIAQQIEVTVDATLTPR